MEGDSHIPAQDTEKGNDANAQEEIEEERERRSFIPQNMRKLWNLFAHESTSERKDMKDEKIAKINKKTSEETAKKKTKGTVPLEPMQIAQKSDAGGRTLDEDSIVVIDFSGSYESEKLRRTLAIVADGVGGHSKGEIASYFATKIISSLVSPLFLDKNVEGQKLEDSLRASFQKANETIIDYAKNNPECEGMGTTASAAIIVGARLHVGHVGDTRVYVMRNHDITQITKDHSLVQELVDKGEITPEEARTHPQKNYITRAIGARSNLQVDIFSRTLEDGDFILLCCDGLVNEVEDHEILHITLDSESLQDACDELVDLANKRGGRDNISVILIGPIKVPEIEMKMEAPTQSRSPVESEIGTLPKPAARMPCPICFFHNEPSATLCRYCKTELPKKK